MTQTERLRWLISYLLDERGIAEALASEFMGGAPMTTNLRCDETFVEEAGIHAAAGVGGMNARFQDLVQDFARYLLIGIFPDGPGAGYRFDGVHCSPFLRSEPTTWAMSASMSSVREEISFAAIASCLFTTA